MLYGPGIAPQVGPRSNDSDGRDPLTFAPWWRSLRATTRLGAAYLAREIHASESDAETRTACGGLGRSDPCDLNGWRWWRACCSSRRLPRSPSPFISSIRARSQYRWPHPSRLTRGASSVWVKWGSGSCRGRRSCCRRCASATPRGVRSRGWHRPAGQPPTSTCLRCSQAGWASSALLVLVGYIKMMSYCS